MEKVKYITIGGFDFIITEELDFNNQHYMIAVDEKGEDTMVVLKQIYVDGKLIAKPVQDDDELEMVFELIKRENNID